MQQSSIQEQVEVIKKATKIAMRSKKSALQFLIDAGIISPSEAKDFHPPKNKK